jgi:DNA-binding transcriptional MerR regulator
VYLKELSQRSGVSVPSIKFYLREGLLKPGTQIGTTRADYGEEHLRRLELILTLRKVVGLGLDAIGTITAAIDDPAVGGLELLGRTQSLVLGLAGEPVPDHPLLAGLLGDRWEDRPSAARNSLNALLHRMESLGVPPDAQVLQAYADAVDQVAALDIGSVASEESRDGMVMSTAVGVHLYSGLLQGMLALAQTSRAMRQFP